jgi:hypothetical protein
MEDVLCEKMEHFGGWSWEAQGNHVRQRYWVWILEPRRGEGKRIMNLNGRREIPYAGSACVSANSHPKFEPVHRAIKESFWNTQD